MTYPADQDTATMGRSSPPAGGSLVEVHLLGLPVLVMRASREHHDGLMREFRILALAGRVEDADLPARLLELVQILGQRYDTRGRRRHADLEAAAAAGLEVLDEVEVVPVDASEAMVRLGELMGEADSYCRQALLMTLPRPALVRRFGQWYLTQFVDQLAGRPAVRWDGPLRVQA